MINRHDEPPEKLDKMFAHKGVCRHCPQGVVKMMRHKKTGVLLPNQCFCLMCGQHYEMDIPDIATWEEEQWYQKAHECDAHITKNERPKIPLDSIKSLAGGNNLSFFDKVFLKVKRLLTYIEKK